LGFTRPVAVLSDLPWQSWRASLAATFRDAASRTLLGFALAFCVIFNTSHFAVFETRTPTLLALAFLMSVLGVGLFFMVASLHRFLFALLVPVASVLSGAAVYFIRAFHVYINENTMALLFETNSDEAAGFVGVELGLYLLVALLLSIPCLLWGLSRLREAPLAPRLHWVFALSFVLFVIPQSKYIRNTQNAYLPTSIFTKGYVYLRESARRDALLQHRKNVGKAYPLKLVDPDLTVVLVIGESARGDHFSINGYARETSPKLARRGVISFGDVLSCDANTRYAVPCMMTRGTRKNIKLPYEETSLVSVFRELGFDTHWISNQGTFWAGLTQAEITVSAVTAIANEAEHVKFINKTGDTDYQRVIDESLFPHYATALARQPTKQLIVLHTVGSHWHFDSHYPPGFRKWTPLCDSNNPNSCEVGHVINSYDNAILYTDHVVDHFMQQVGDRKALVVYLGDHGEGLGEDGIYSHHFGSLRREELHVPWVVWATPKFRAAYPERVQAMNSHRKQPLTHDFLFHSMLDCAGIESPLIDKSLSVCR